MSYLCGTSVSGQSVGYTLSSAIDQLALDRPLGSCSVQSLGAVSAGVLLPDRELQAGLQNVSGQFYFESTRSQYFLGRLRISETPDRTFEPEKSARNPFRSQRMSP